MDTVFCRQAARQLGPRGQRGPRECWLTSTLEHGADHVLPTLQLCSCTIDAPTAWQSIPEPANPVPCPFRQSSGGSHRKARYQVLPITCGRVSGIDRMEGWQGFTATPPDTQSCPCPPWILVPPAPTWVCASGALVSMAIPAAEKGLEKFSQEAFRTCIFARDGYWEG